MLISKLKDFKNQVITSLVILIFFIIGLIIYETNNSKDNIDNNIRIETITYQKHEYTFVVIVTTKGNKEMQSSGLSHSPDCKFCENKGIAYK